MGTFILKRSIFSIYDDTDNIKRMKDSDILAEKKKRNPSFQPVITNSISGGLAGAAAGTLVGAVGGGMKAGQGFKSKMIGIGKGSYKGALVGAAVGAGVNAARALKKRSKEKEDNQFYNERLEYAQRQALRRERADWKANNTQRDGYSY